MAEAVELKILRGVRKTIPEVRSEKDNTRTLDFRRVYFRLLREPLRMIPWETVLEGKEAQEIWLIFNHTPSGNKNCPFWSSRHGRR